MSGLLVLSLGAGVLGEACPFSASEASAVFCFFLGGIVNGGRASERVSVCSLNPERRRAAVEFLPLRFPEQAVVRARDGEDARPIWD